MAELKPFAAGGDEEESRLDHLVALGLLTRESRISLRRLKRLSTSGKSLSTAIIEGRDA